MRCRPRHLGGQGSRQSGQDGSGCGNCDADLPVQGAHIATLSHPEPGHTYLQQHAENVPADDEQFSRGCCHCRHGSESGGWVVGSECCRFRGPLASRSPLLGALPQPRWPRLKYPPTAQVRMRAIGGGSVRRGGRGRSSFVRRGKKIIHLLFPHRPPPPEFILAPFQKIPLCPRLNFNVKWRGNATLS